jgi:hypothetical protein
MEKYPRRGITAMDHDVAVGTSPVLQHARLLIHRGIAARGHCQELTGVERVGVAALAEHRLFHDQQGLVRAAVRIMAVEAAFPYRRMLVEEGTALFCVALVALVIYGVGGDQPLGLRAVRIMTIRTKHFFFAERVMGGFQQRRPDLLVTPGTELLLAGLSQQLIVSAVNLVAIHTGKLRFVVLAPVPHCNVASGVARQADRIPLGGRQGLCEVHETTDATTTAAAHMV